MPKQPIEKKSAKAKPANDNCAGLEERLAQREAELELITSVQQALASKIELQAIYDLIGDKVREIFNAQVVVITTFDHAKQEVHFHYELEHGERFYPDPIPFTGFARSQIKRGKTILINEGMERSAARLGMVDITDTGWRPKSLVAVPFVTGNLVTGGISLQNDDRENAFSQADVRLLETLAASISVALENARLFDETQRLLKETEQRNTELAIINSVQQALASKLEMQAIYDLIGDKIREIFDAQIVTIVSYDRVTDQNIIHYAINNGKRHFYDPVPTTQMYKELMATGTPIIVQRNLAERLMKKSDLLKDPTGHIPQFPKSGVWIPLSVASTVTGHVSLQNVDSENAFSVSDIRLLTTLANSMAIALENARLFDETQHLLKETEQRNAELAIINSVQQGLASKLDMQAIYDLVGDKLREVFKTHGVAIIRYDFPAKLAYTPYFFKKGQRFYFDDPNPLLPPEYFIHAKRAPESIMLNTRSAIEEHLEKWGITVVPGTDVPRSLLDVPLVVDGNITGLVSLIEVDRENAFSESDVRLLETLAASMSVALENARLFEETQRLLKETEQRNAELAIINSVQQGLASKLEMQAIYDLVGDKLREVFKTHGVVIFRYDVPAKLLYTPYFFKKGQRFYFDNDTDPLPEYFLDKGNGSVSVILNTEKEVLAHAEKWGGELVPGTDVPRSRLDVPLMVNGNPTGLFRLIEVERENAFTESDMRLLETLAASLSVALENARLFEAEQTYLKYMASELEVGRQIQQQFLPSELPNIPGWELAVHFQAAREVAGDFYDAFLINALGYYVVVVGDVCDKGVGAALYMTLFRSLIRASASYFASDASEDLSPEVVLGRIVSATNTYVAQVHGQSSMFATIFCGLIAPHGNQLYYVNGGHEPAYLVKAGTMKQRLPPTGLVVGLFDGSPYSVARVEVQPHDTLWIFSDGVTEAEDNSGNPYSSSELEGMITNMAEKPLPDQVDALHHNLAAFSNFATPKDDMTILCLKRS